MRISAHPRLVRAVAAALAAVLPVLGAGCTCGTTGGGPDSDLPGTDAGNLPGSDAGGGYSESYCETLADLSDLQAAYTPAAYRAAAEGIATRRYPIGLVPIQDDSDGNLMTWLDEASFDGVLDTMEIAVHEGTHIWDFTNSPPGSWSYRVRDDLVITTLSLTNFARSEILALHADPATDFYDDVYLTGFSGSQGFNNLLDEYNAYVHSLAIRYCTRDSLPPGSSTSARDGILTFMYYVELYLKVARTNHAADYAEIVADPGHVTLILTIWDRAEFWLGLTAGNPELGISDDVIATWTYDADNLMEIDLLR